MSAASVRRTAPVPQRSALSTTVVAVPEAGPSLARAARPGPECRECPGAPREAKRRRPVLPDGPAPAAHRCASASVPPRPYVRRLRGRPQRAAMPCGDCCWAIPSFAAYVDATSLPTAV